MQGWLRRRFYRDPRLWWALGLGMLACYVLSYLAFSVRGQYVPFGRYMNTDPAVDNALYVWAPGEFYDYTVRRFRPGYVLPYYPLLEMDQRFWHTEEKSYDRRYPIHRRHPEKRRFLTGRR